MILFSFIALIKSDLFIFEHGIMQTKLISDLKDINISPEIRELTLVVVKLDYFF